MLASWSVLLIPSHPIPSVCVLDLLWAGGDEHEHEHEHEHWGREHGIRLGPVGLLPFAVEFVVRHAGQRAIGYSRGMNRRLVELVL